MGPGRFNHIAPLPPLILELIYMLILYIRLGHIRVGSLLRVRSGLGPPAGAKIDNNTSN